MRGDASAFGGNITFAPASATSAPGVVFDQATDGSFTNTFSGAGRVTKAGSGALTLTGNNTHTGGTQLDAGVLSITADAQLGAASGALDFNGGTLAVQASGFEVTTNRATTLGAASGTIDMAAGASMEHTGVISGPGGLTKTGPGDLSLRGANTYQGGTTVNGGILAGTTASFGSGDVVIDAGLLLLFPASGSNVFANDVHGAGALASRTLGGVVLTGQSTYRGGTYIYGGSMSISSDANLGDAAGTLNFVGQFNDSVLRTTADLTTHRATHLTRQGTFDVLAGTTLTHQGVIGGGARMLKVGAGRMVLTGTNTYGGGTTIAAGTLEGNAGSFGSGAITNNASLIIEQGSDATLPNAIGGSGSFTKTGAGALTLAGANTHSGATVLSEGVLRAGAVNRFSAASAHRLAAGTTLDLAGFSQTVAALDNGGTVSLVGVAPGTALTVTGAYVGRDALLRLGTALGDSSSASDRLVLDGAGASASGRTTLELINLGGLGAQTTGDGIELIAARNGATTTAQSTRDAFVLQGDHVDAGAYEYRLHAGDAHGAGESWFLRSTAIVGNAPSTTYRVEVPLFAALPAQLREGDLTMLGSLAQRRGDKAVQGSGSEAAFSLRQLSFAPAQAALEDVPHQAWARVLGSRLRIEHAGTVDPHSRGHQSGLQAGTDLWADARWRVGLYAGQLDSDFDVRGFAGGVANAAVGGNALRSQYLGAYASWSRPDGLYIDAVLQGGQHRYAVNPLNSPTASGKASSLSSSIEIGHALPLVGHWRIEPQLQLVHQDLDIDAVDIPGAQVQQRHRGNWLGRVGMRIAGDLNTTVGRLRPYANLNLYRTASGSDSTPFVNPMATTTITTGGAGTSAELAAGLALTVGNHTSLHASLGRRWALGGDAGVRAQLQASLGLRVHW